MSTFFSGFCYNVHIVFMHNCVLLTWSMKDDDDDNDDDDLPALQLPTET